MNYPYFFTQITAVLLDIFIQFAKRAISYS